MFLLGDCFGHRERFQETDDGDGQRGTHELAEFIAQDTLRRREPRGNLTDDADSFGVKVGEFGDEDVKNHL